MTDTRSHARPGRRHWRIDGALGLAVLTLTSGCATLPGSGPTKNQILREERDEAGAIGFSIVDISATTLPAATIDTLRSTIGLEALNRPGRADLLGPGDVLQIQIYEVGISLFGSTTSLGGSGDSTGGDGFTPSARGQTIGVVVDRNGAITLPYIGRLQVAGRSTSDVQQMIVRGLAGKSQAPQALVTVKENVTNTVLVSGGVTTTGRLSLSIGGMRLLEAIARAGGLRGTILPQSAIVRFGRGAQNVEVYLDTIVPGSPADVLLLPGDRIDVIPRERSLTVFGAAPRVSEIKFETEQLSLAEAIARAGGPDSQSADPSAVFVFRYSGDATQPTGQVPTIYRLNLLKPSSYFLAQRFRMLDKDVVYIANARSNQTRKLVEIIGQLISPVIAARQISQ